jgi:Ca2+-binding RTX toxin-like protein
MHGLGRRRGTRLGRQFARTGAAFALAAAIGTGGAALAADITGTNGPDNINGTQDADNIQALGGDDRVNGRGGNDVIDGGTGNDTLDGGDAIDQVSGDIGDDQIFGGSGRDGLVGEEGNDTLDGGADNDFTLAGGDGNDTVRGGAGNDDVDGDEGNDLLLGGAGDDDMFGLEGDDNMSGEAGDDELFGGPGIDALSGGTDVDELQGEEGADRIEGGGGNDELEFFPSAFQPDSTFAVRDVVLDFQGAGLTGGDTLRLTSGDFAWVGRIDGNPRIGAVLPGGGDGLTQLGYVQQPGQTFLVADSNDDGLLDQDDFTVEFRGVLNFTPDDFDNTSFIIAGTNGDDVITGTEEGDRIFAAGGNDTVTALGGDDEVHGGAGDDFLEGGPGGFDNLFGEEGNDQLTLATSDGGGVASGGDGDDVLFGSDTSFSNFDNSLQGDAGNDDLHAGAVGSSANGAQGLDRLFSSAADDQLEAGRDESGFELDNARDLFVYTGTGRWSTEGSFFGDQVSGFQDGSDLFDLRGSGLRFRDLTIENGDFQTTISSSRGTITIFESFGQEVAVNSRDFLF